jgi:hypothetical protein
MTDDPTETDSGWPCTTCGGSGTLDGKDCDDCTLIPVLRDEARGHARVEVRRQYGDVLGQAGYVEAVGRRWRALTPHRRQIGPQQATRHEAIALCMSAWRELRDVTGITG